VGVGLSYDKVTKGVGLSVTMGISNVSQMVNHNPSYGNVNPPTYN
jgi:hypothetical protein